MDKDYILSEIKRTASKNGGVALGRERFAHETGIKYSDWFGKYWVRWGDAVREAGVNPNKMQRAFDDEFLILKFISLMRELGRFPIHGDLRMKARNDKTFPSWNTFGRFGKKGEFAKRILEFCDQQTTYDDVAEICRSIPMGKSVNSQRLRENNQIFGYVYLLKSGKYYKIGKTNAVGRREYELAIQLPERAKKVHVITTDDPSGIEAYWHRRFENRHKNGEWFQLTADDVKAFCRRKFM